MTDKEDGPRSAYKRFGGGHPLVLADGTSADIGEVIQSGGPGKGFSMVPWALDRYERVMRLRPGEAWLLRRMMSHVWEYGGNAFLSFRKMARETCATRKTLGQWADRLEELGYVVCVSDPLRTGMVKRYDVRPASRALAACILLDSCLKTNRAGTTAAPSEDELSKFDLDLEALMRLNRDTDEADDNESQNC